MVESYRGEASAFLSKYGITEGDQLLLALKNGKELRGTLMPSYSNDESILVIKLENGYNVGISYKYVESVKVIERRGKGVGERTTVLATGGEVKIISTGGTIVSKIEYETGAVRPALSTEEILQFVPEAKEFGTVSAEILFSILSEEMKPTYWEKIAEAVKKAFDEGVRGVVVAHGTDTMAYTAAALSFSLRTLQGPVVLVGSQRSSDRPSSDSAINLLSSILLAKQGEFGEVVVNMHGETSDTYTLAHRGVKVRKMHTSRRDAFQSINSRPLARVWWRERKLEMIEDEVRQRGASTVLETGFDDRVFLLKYWPGLRPEVVEQIVSSGVRGIIIEGTGLGHTSKEFAPYLRKAVKEGVFVGMTSQCLFGAVNMNVYTTGRTLMEAGVTPLLDMLPEVALVKLMWVLKRASDLEEVRKLMINNLVGEINVRHTVEMYPRWDSGR
ncbi:Glu-tRNA(Gln) amidotransferase subunit GatD [Sulfodiicoccus acidiphilus]|uniref:Glu-tRNA(Gln) amidotransferase subunit GatD n=1 Tax=Sulfodiicoccus acidiphilus TaxID=1670455 RepID=UPI000F835DD0|nr:Glu-tRNA(Gln) amidotransferase subunit GatD [Sulfodiicoccus acidiphilus]